MYMKPFDGGGWRGVSRINDRDDLHQAYDESGEMLMHLQATVEYEHFARALSIGPETMVMDFRPDQPMHNRYAVSHGFLGESAGNQTAAISRIVNAFFGWEFNSCEMLVAGDEVYPIDYANACPDVAVTSLHYYFPWAIKALVRWSVYASPPAARADVDLQTRRYFEIADDDRPRTTRSSTPTSPSPTSTSTPTATGTGAREPPAPRRAGARVGRPPTHFDRLLRETVQATYPAHEQDLHGALLGPHRPLGGRQQAIAPVRRLRCEGKPGPSLETIERMGGFEARR